MARDPEAQTLWEQVYERLSTGQPGILGAVLGRAESQTLRLSMIYAIADRSALIQRCHLEAGGCQCFYLPCVKIEFESGESEDRRSELSFWKFHELTISGAVVES